MTAYYNEIDPQAAAWLRELIRRGLIAPGEVDERNIRDVSPDDLRSFTQCHFFAGIGVWSYALRRAGWPDDRPVWTGSCPCQPFSTAGKGGGFADERHLWPSWYWLIDQCRPAVVFGEQVASKDAEPWLDLVQADLEALAYSLGAIPFPSAGVGAPHIRDRLYWVADAESERGGAGFRDRGSGRSGLAVVGDNSAVCRLAQPNGGKLQGIAELRRAERDGKDPGRAQGGGGVADTTSRRCRDERQQSGGQHGLLAKDRGPDGQGNCGAQSGPSTGLVGPGPVNGLWRNADWLFCRDGKWRPVEPGTFPLAHGAPARVGRLRGYGNAINAQAAAAFIEAYLRITV